MLEEGHTTLRKRYTYIIFIDNDLLYGEWGGREIFSLFIRGVLQKLIEKHWPKVIGYNYAVIK